jgi:hypothetical protein
MSTTLVLETVRKPISLEWKGIVTRNLWLAQLIICRRWHKVILDILYMSAAKKDKKIHYYEIVKLAAAAGLTHQHLSQAQKRAGMTDDLPVAAKMFHKIVKYQLVTKPRPGTAKHAVSSEWQESIATHWKSISRVAPHDVFVVKRKTSSSPTIFSELYYQQYPIKEAFALFKQTHPDFPFRLCSYQKFKPPCVKKPKSLQDACPICKESKRYLAILTAAHPLNLNHDDIEAKAAYEFHKKVRNTRYSDYNNQMENLKQGHAILVLDFKANITLGKGPVEDSGVFFRAPQRTIFGGAAFFVSEENVRYKVHFTVISAVLKHDSKTLLEILRSHIFCHPIWKHFNVANTQVWMDNASQHFRNYQTLATFHDLGLELGMTFQLNFFAEYHGKSECDKHFGLLGRMYKEATRFEASKEIRNTEDFILMYSDGIRRTGGHVIPQQGCINDGLLPESKRKPNVIVSEFAYEGQVAFLAQLNASGSSAERNKPIMPLPYRKREMKMSSIQKGNETVDFGLNLYYKFNFVGQVVEARLDDGAAKTDFPFHIEESHEPKYQVTFGTATSWRPKYSCVARVVRRRQYHEEEDYGAAVHFLNSAATEADDF